MAYTVSRTLTNTHIHHNRASTFHPVSSGSHGVLLRCPSPRSDRSGPLWLPPVRWPGIIRYGSLSTPSPAPAPGPLYRRAAPSLYSTAWPGPPPVAPTANSRCPQPNFVEDGGLPPAAHSWYSSLD